MRICIFGAGATGGHFAVRLAAAGHEVSVVARGASLEAITRHGLHLESGFERSSARPRAAEDPAALGIQDVVIVGVKATALAGVARGLSPLVGPETLLLFPQNGMPWWYPVGLPKVRPAPPELPGFRLAPEFLRFAEPGRIFGGLIYSANTVQAPGRILNTSPEHNAIKIGAIDGDGGPAAHELRATFTAAGIDAPEVADIRAAMWEKLTLNMSGSVIALATDNQSSVSRRDPDLGRIYLRVIHEGLAIADAHGYPLDRSIDPGEMQRRLLDHKPSLLQDFEQGRPMELREIVAAPLAFAQAAGVAAPTLEVLAAVVMRRARDRQLIQD